MSVLGFLSSLVGSLAWPAVTLCLVLVFRGPLADLIGRLKSAKWGDKEAVFERASEALQVQLDEIFLDSSKVDAREDASDHGPALPSEEDSSASTEPTTAPWSRWARDPQERYAKVVSKWRHPSRSVPLQRVAQEMVATGVPEFPAAAPPRFTWYLNQRDPFGSATEALHDLTDWVEFLAARLGADDSANVKRSIVHIAEVASLDETKLLSAWRNLASMNLVVQAGRGIDQGSDEATRFVRSVEQFAQTLFDAIEPGIDIVRSAYEDAVAEIGEDQAVQQEIDRRRGK